MKLTDLIPAGMTPKEFADHLNRLTPAQIATAMESLPTDALEFGVRFEALSHRSPSFEELYGPWICMGCGTAHELGSPCPGRGCKTRAKAIDQRKELRANGQNR